MTIKLSVMVEYAGKTQGLNAEINIDEELRDNKISKFMLREMMSNSFTMMGDKLSKTVVDNLRLVMNEPEEEGFKLET